MNVMECFEPDESTDQIQQIKELAEKAVLSEASEKAMAEEKNNAKMALIELMQTAGLQKVATDSGLTPSLTVKHYVGMKDGIDEEVVKTWLKTNGLGDVMKITMTLTPQMADYFVEFVTEASQHLAGKWASLLLAMLDAVNVNVDQKTLSSAMTEFNAQGGEIPETLFVDYEQATIRMNGKSKFLAAREAAAL
jgi:hypothetical protein